MKDFSLEKIRKILALPLGELLYKAQKTHKKYFKSKDVQLASLISIKTGACPEDCKYCPQSAHYNVGLKKEKLIDLLSLENAAIQAKKNGAHRFCMGAAWKKLRDGKDLETVVKMIKTVKSLDLEACVTLGSITKDQAEKLKDAGLDAYNHNIDTSPEFYKEIVTTRSFEERLETLNNVRHAGINVCSGGILGMGETWDDRAKMLKILSDMDPQPESVPINALVPVKGTPLQNQKSIDSIEIVRVIATARIIMPKSRIRLSAGRKSFSKETQILCLLSGANSIFYGDNLLTTENNDMKEDKKLINSFINSDEEILEEKKNNQQKSIIDMKDYA
ncbi:biotin synthase BioB [Alphaproteobacteria bacterium]|nr:biotin synthase BioB [Alphaproteobacteria bacterium]